MKKSTLGLFIIFLLIPVLGWSHGSHGSGFVAGFTHPIFGIDHALTILGIGILSYYLDPKKWFFYPIAFIVPMVIGGILGTGQEGMVFVERIIASSVMLTGLSLALLKPKSSPIVLIALTIFGAFHGFAHGTEMPEGTTAMKYIPGFVNGALLLSCVGLMISKAIDKTVNSLRYYVLTGGFIAGAGFIILYS